MLVMRFRLSMNAVLSIAIMEKNMSEVPKKTSEFSKMSTAEFAQFAMQTGLAPRSMGQVQTRLRHATGVLTRRRWTKNRVRDLWYRDPRASQPKWEEIHDLEELTGLQYARQELAQNDQLIRNADALLMGGDPDFYGAFVAAARAFFGARNRPGTGH